MVAPPRRKIRAGTPRPPVSESHLHRTVADLLDWVLVAPTVWTTFPAGRGRFSPALGGILKAEGLKPGFPDIFIWSTGGCIGIELKAGKNKQSDAQRDVADRLMKVGVKVYVCRSTTDVIMALADACIPYRKTDIIIPKGKTNVEILALTPYGSGIPGDG